MAILGSIENGLTGAFPILAVKATLDGFASLAFASSLGVGVLFSVLPLFVYQGAITLLASQVQSVVSTPMMNEMSATGGLILIAIAISGLLELKPIRAGNFLPALHGCPLDRLYPEPYSIKQDRIRKYLQVARCHDIARTTKIYLILSLLIAGGCCLNRGFDRGGDRICIDQAAIHQEGRRAVDILGSCHM